MGIGLRPERLIDSFGANRSMESTQHNVGKVGAKSACQRWINQINQSPRSLWCAVGLPLLRSVHSFGMKWNDMPLSAGPWRNGNGLRWLESNRKSSFVSNSKNNRRHRTHAQTNKQLILCWWPSYQSIQDVFMVFLWMWWESNTNRKSSLWAHSKSLSLSIYLRLHNLLPMNLRIISVE